MKDKVLLDPLSRDGDKIVEQISHALESGDFSKATDTWEYILSRRIELKPDLSPEQEAKVAAEIGRLADEKIFVLSRGAIEEYLPEGIGKDMSRLIDALGSDDFCNQMPAPARTEIERIIKRSAA